jgi:hypothetical protein
MLAARYGEARSNDDRGADPGGITEDQITEDRSPDQRDIAKRGEDRRRAADLERAVGNVKRASLRRLQLP